MVRPHVRRSRPRLASSIAGSAGVDNERASRRTAFLSPELRESTTPATWTVIKVDHRQIELELLCTRTW